MRNLIFFFLLAHEWSQSKSVAELGLEPHFKSVSLTPTSGDSEPATLGQPWGNCLVFFSPDSRRSARKEHSRDAPRQEKLGLSFLPFCLPPSLPSIFIDYMVKKDGKGAEERGREDDILVSIGHLLS